MSTEDRKQRILEWCEKEQSIIKLEDGTSYVWVDTSGAMSAFDLRVVADELDRRNAASGGIVDAP